MGESFSDAVSRRGVRVSECVRLPVYVLDTHPPRPSPDGIAKNHRAAFECGVNARRAGLPKDASGYNPQRAASSHRAWLKGWERG